ncbi:unnamed protein product [Brassica napus]|uniref:(rape) hypothetical protein n=1 Tax=Brassica napus TaxID=3708 RepID=A0A816IGF3_BRANA|nr:unnamed protein product [Brassica napus]
MDTVPAKVQRGQCTEVTKVILTGSQACNLEEPVAADKLTARSPTTPLSVYLPPTQNKEDDTVVSALCGVNCSAFKFTSLYCTLATSLTLAPT